MYALQFVGCPCCSLLYAIENIIAHNPEVLYVV